MPVTLRDALTLPEILEELRLNRGYFPREAVEAAIERRGEMVPELLRILDEAAERPEELLEEPAAIGHLYALYLLAQFREPAAFPRIVRLFSLPAELEDELTGEVATEGLDRMLASLNHGDVASIQRLIEDPQVSEWVRGGALGALEGRVFSGQLSREEVVAYLGDLFVGKLERQHSNAWNCLVSVAANLHATELAPQLRRAFEEGLVDPFFTSPEELEKELSQPREVVLKRSRRRAKGPIEDVVREMSWWACFHKPDLPAESGLTADDTAAAASTLPSRQLEKRWMPLSTPFVREGPKVGRNDPCPCGSGKKHKRCCGSRTPG